MVRTGENVLTLYSCRVPNMGVHNGMWLYSSPPWGIVRLNITWYTRSEERGLKIPRVFFLKNDPLLYLSVHIRENTPYPNSLHEHWRYSWCNPLSRLSFSPFTFEFDIPSSHMQKWFFDGCTLALEKLESCSILDRINLSSLPSW